MDRGERTHPLPRTRRVHRETGSQYSSSDGDESPSNRCAEPLYSKDRIHKKQGARGAHSLGLTPDENHISPIENLDGLNLDGPNNRLYSYLSGSEGDTETDHPITPPQRGREENWEYCGSASPSSSRSSRCSSVSRSDSEPEPESHPHHNTGAMNTLSSGGGENVYSRINETATLPMPPIPPPPCEDVPGPAVPPRRNIKRFNTACTPQSGGEISNRTAYTEVESDFEPQYMVQSAAGNVFFHQGRAIQDASPSVPNFPRTVPRTHSLPPAAQSPGQLPPPTQQPPPPPSMPELISAAQQQRLASDGHLGNEYQSTNITATMVPSNSTDRIKLQLKEMEESWARQNTPYSPTANLAIPQLPTYPSVQNDFRDYSRFSTASYRFKKQVKRRCSWRLLALILLFIVIVLTAVVAYFIGSLFVSSTAPTTTGQFSLGQYLEEEVPPKSFWKTQFYMAQSQFIKYNFTIPDKTFLGVYGRKNVEPTHTQYDFFHVIDGQHNRHRKRSIYTQPEVESRDSAFIHYMEAGLWFVFLYNDNENPQKMSFMGRKHDSHMSDCPKGCHGRGDCHQGQCSCFSGYTGWDCSQTQCPVLCDGNGVYNAGECDCYPGWKGKECDVPDDECEVPNCSGNGKCVHGRCVCSPGYGGQDCNEETCLVAKCSDNGACVRGRCLCFHGYIGSDCSLVDLGPVVCTAECSHHGAYQTTLGACRCESGWTGATCEQEVCDLDCLHGVCTEQRCLCEAGWSGALCDQVECDRRCTQNGYCNNGTCVCKQGYNGRHCTLAGCPNACNNNGACQLFLDQWRCNCRDGWKGEACEVAMEVMCEDGNDEDTDGLTDCQDPDCCISISCKDSYHCDTSPDPMEILLRKQPPSTTASFYDRMRFLVEDKSVQNYATLSSFNHSQVSVIRGKVISSDGSPLIGVRVSVVTQPLYGFTLTRELGLFDILVNGGGSVTLMYQRQPFENKKVTVMVPWNQMITMEPVTLTLPEEEVPGAVECEVEHNHYEMKPVVLSTWQHTQLGACPSKSSIIPESQVLQESLQIPGTGVYLVYHSSETPGYMSTIMIQLTPDFISQDLAIVHLRVAVEGLVFEKMFEADPGLKYKFAWDRRNAYNQKVYGIVTASVGVGYQYQGCSHVFWEMQSATMSGYDITSSEIGGWNLHIHHTYNFQEGILHKGDGTNIYLKEQPRKVVTVLGNGRQRRLDCRSCDGDTENSRLMAPVALASGRDGSLYVGDFNHIRKLSASRQEVASILELSMPEVPYKYYMTVSPLDGKLYISDYQTKRIVRVKTMGAVRELSQNMEVIAGTGDQCIPGDPNRCGDRGPAVEANLFYPKGIAINKDGIVYFADGANVRIVDKDDVISTLIGSQGQPTNWEPLPCGQVVSIMEVKLRWPTALAVNPLDDTLHILDNDMVLKVTKDGKVLIVAGHPLHCPPKDPNINPLLTEDQAGPKLANEVILEHPQHISFAPNGYLYIVESDNKFINRVREVKTDGTIHHYIGDKSNCNCEDPECRCYDPDEVLATKILLNSPTAITVTADNVVHVSDMGNLRIHSIVATLSEPDRYGQYTILYPQTQEIFIFNRFGQHVNTKNIITDQYVYNFTYTVNSYYGKLQAITDAEGNRLTIRRSYTTQAEEIIPPGGQKCRFIMDNMGQLHLFIAADNATTKFTYLDNTGLLETKETSEGHTFVYDYDDNGRLASVVEPTGEDTTLSTDVDPSGAIARLSTDKQDRVALATNGNLLSVLHGKARTKVSYLRDGALVVEYPFNMAITMETIPHPLLSTDHQLHVKRKVILPNNLVHRLEWRYYLRKDRRSSQRKVLSRIGRRMRVGERAPASRHVGSRSWHDLDLDPALHGGSEGTSGGYSGKALWINGENLLTMEYDRETHSETILDVEGEEILTILYNNAGEPTHFLTDSPLLPVNITYNNYGRPLLWARGDLQVVNTYDERTGYLVERRVGGRASYRYIYKSGTKPTDVILPSGKQFVLGYDHYGNLKSIIMPSLAQHQFNSLTTLHWVRRLYKPPGVHGHYIEDYNSAGKLLKTTYPSLKRTVTFVYNQISKLQAIYYDWSDVHFDYHENEGVLKQESLDNRVAFNFSCVMTYGPAAALVKHYEVWFNRTGFRLLSAKYGYHYDANFRLVSLEAQLGSYTFRPVNFSYSSTTGKLENMKAFTFEYPSLIQEIIQDENMEITKEFDTHGRLTDIWTRFNNYIVFTLEVKYDEQNHIQQWRRKVGTSDLKAYEYVYDIDSNVVEVILSGQTTWRYEYDANNNIIRIGHYEETKQVLVNADNQITGFEGENYVFDEDGFLVRRDNEIFDYNSLGQLVRAFELGKYDIHYFYDTKNRIVARRDVMGNYIIQFFYADITHPERITHLYDHATQMATVLHYDNHGKLFAMEQDGRYFYIALDPMGSPIIIFNAVGGVVKQMTYDPLGVRMTDSAPEFHFIFGYQGGIVDHTTRFIHFGPRVYDPRAGRWTAPDYKKLLHNLNEVMMKPGCVNHYQFPQIVPYEPLHEGRMTDISSWLGLLGYDLESLVPQVSFTGEIRPQKKHSRRLMPVTSAFECAFQRDMQNFIDMSTVPRSKVTMVDGYGKMAQSFSPISYVFGDGVLVSSYEGHVKVGQLESAGEQMGLLATVLLNNTEAVPLHFSIHGRDTHYFVKPTLEEAISDVRELTLRTETSIGALNITVHRYHEDGDTMKFVDIRIRGNHTVVNLRYGTNVYHEKQRILKHTKDRTIAHAWQLELESIRDNRETIHSWSRNQKEELLEHGFISNMEPMYLRETDDNIQLLDDPRNIKFIPKAR